MSNYGAVDCSFLHNEINLKDRFGYIGDDIYSASDEDDIIEEGKKKRYIYQSLEDDQRVPDMEDEVIEDVVVEPTGVFATEYTTKGTVFGPHPGKKPVVLQEKWLIDNNGINETETISLDWMKDVRRSSRYNLVSVCNRGDTFYVAIDDICPTDEYLLTDDDNNASEHVILLGLDGLTPASPIKPSQAGPPVALAKQGQGQDHSKTVQGQNDRSKLAGGQLGGTLPPQGQPGRYKLSNRQQKNQLSFLQHRIESVKKLKSKPNAKMSKQALAKVFGNLHPTQVKGAKRGRKSLKHEILSGEKEIEQYVAEAETLASRLLDPPQESEATIAIRGIKQDISIPMGTRILTAISNSSLQAASLNITQSPAGQQGQPCQRNRPQMKSVLVAVPTDHVAFLQPPAGQEEEIPEEPADSQQTSICTVIPPAVTLYSNIPTNVYQNIMTFPGDSNTPLVSSISGFALSFDGNNLQGNGHETKLPPGTTLRITPAPMQCILAPSALASKPEPCIIPPANLNNKGHRGRNKAFARRSVPRGPTCSVTTASPLMTEEGRSVMKPLLPQNNTEIKPNKRARKKPTVTVMSTNCNGLIPTAVSPFRCAFCMYKSFYRMHLIAHQVYHRCLRWSRHKGLERGCMCLQAKLVVKKKIYNNSNREVYTKPMKPSIAAILFHCRFCTVGFMSRRELMKHVLKHLR